MRHAFASASALWFIAAGCASGPDAPPGQDAIIEASNELQASVETGAIASNDRPSYRVLIRHNPSRCPCPQYEVFVYGSWQRAWLDGSESALARIESFKESGEQRMMPIEGVLTSQRRPSERQVTYPVFEIE